MVVSERQASVAEKGEGQVWLSSGAPEAAVTWLRERREIGGADIGQFPASDIAPYRFDRVELRGIPGQAQPSELSTQVGLHGPALVGPQRLMPEDGAGCTGARAASRMWVSLTQGLCGGGGLKSPLRSGPSPTGSMKPAREPGWWCRSLKSNQLGQRPDQTCSC